MEHQNSQAAFLNHSFDEYNTSKAQEKSLT